MKLLVQAFLSGTSESSTPHLPCNQNGLMSPATSYIFPPIPRVAPTFSPEVNSVSEVMNPFKSSTVFQILYFQEKKNNEAFYFLW